MRKLDKDNEFIERDTTEFVKSILKSKDVDAINKIFEYNLFDLEDFAFDTTLSKHPVFYTETDPWGDAINNKLEIMIDYDEPAIKPLIYVNYFANRFYLETICKPITDCIVTGTSLNFLEHVSLLICERFKLDFNIDENIFDVHIMFFGPRASTHEYPLYRVDPDNISDTFIPLQFQRIMGEI